VFGRTFDPLKNFTVPGTPTLTHFVQAASKMATFLEFGNLTSFGTEGVSKLLCLSAFWERVSISTNPANFTEIGAPTFEKKPFKHIPKSLYFSGIWKFDLFWRRGGEQIIMPLCVLGEGIHLYKSWKFHRKLHSFFTRCEFLWNVVFSRERCIFHASFSNNLLRFKKSEKNDESGHSNILVINIQSLLIVLFSS